MVCETLRTIFSFEESQRHDRVKGWEKSCSKEYSVALFNQSVTDLINLGSSPHSPAPQ